MAIQLPERSQTAIESLTPREIVAELDKHVVGQQKAKRALAIALRNRLRRQKLPKLLRLKPPPLTSPHPSRKPRHWTNRHR